MPKREVWHGAEELVLFVLPVVGASEMGALGPVGDDGVVGLFDDPGRALLADDLPAVDASAAEGELDRVAGDELGDVAGLGPHLILADARRQEQVDERREAERGAMAAQIP